MKKLTIGIGLVVLGFYLSSSLIFGQVASTSDEEEMPVLDIFFLEPV